MSALSGHPHVRDAERTLMRTIVESFWTVVALTIGLLAFFTLAGGPAVMTTSFVLAGFALLLLWGLHARSVRRHSAEVHSDERWRHARERRGF